MNIFKAYRLNPADKVFFDIPLNTSIIRPYFSSGVPIRDLTKEYARKDLNDSEVLSLVHKITNDDLLLALRSASLIRKKDFMEFAKAFVDFYETFLTYLPENSRVMSGMIDLGGLCMSADYTPEELILLTDDSSGDFWTEIMYRNEDFYGLNMQRFSEYIGIKGQDLSQIFDLSQKNLKWTRA